MAQTQTIIGRLPVNRCEYAEGQTYYKDNYVQYGGSTYCCTAPSTTQPPTDTSAWSLMAGGINEYILQSTGDDEGKVMSQKVVTDAIDTLESTVATLAINDNKVPHDLLSYGYIGINNGEIRRIKRGAITLNYVPSGYGVTTNFTIYYVGLFKYSLDETFISMEWIRKEFSVPDDSYKYRLFVCKSNSSGQIDLTDEEINAIISETTIYHIFNSKVEELENIKLDKADVVDGTGDSTTKVMSQKAVTDAIAAATPENYAEVKAKALGSVQTTDIAQETGYDENKVISQKTVTQELSGLKADVSDLSITLNGGEYFKETIQSEIVTAGGQYGFWVKNESLAVGSTMKVYCKDAQNGTYSISFAGSNQDLGGIFNIVFENGYCEISCPSTNAFWYRVVVNGITADSELSVVGEKDGVIDNLQNDFSNLQAAVTQELSDLKTDVSDIDKTVNGGIVETSDTIEAEFVSSNGNYCYFVPIKSTPTHYKLPNFSSRSITDYYCNSSKEPLEFYTNSTDEDGIITFPEARHSGIKYARITIGTTKPSDAIICENVVSLREECSSKIDGLTSEVNNLQTNANNLQADIEELQNNLSDLQNDVNDKATITKSILQGVCDRSTEKCSPYLYHGLGWNVYNPRINFLMFPDYNDEWELLGDTGKWFNDKVANNSILAIISAGDMVTALTVNKSQWITKANKVIEQVQTLTKPYIFCNGNHDTGQDEYIQSNAANLITPEERYDNFFAPLLDILKSKVGDSNVHTNELQPKSMYYYVDLDAKYGGKKIRIFALDESEYPIVWDETTNKLKYSMCAIRDSSGVTLVGGFNTYYGQKQMQFLVDALTSCPQDALFVVMNHINYAKTSAQGSLCGCKEALEGIIAAYRNNTSGSVSVEAIEDVPEYTVDFDFTSNSGVHPFVHFRGHDHYFGVQKNDYGYSIINLCGGTPTEQMKCKNSVTQYGADIVSIHPAEFTAYFLKFGSGYKKNHNGEDRDGFSYISNPIDLKT